MNETETSVKRFDILGFNIGLKPGDQDDDICPEKIVEIVRKKTNVLFEKAPQLDKAELFLLIALELAKENLKLEAEFKDNINFAQVTTMEILSKVNQMSEIPTN